MNRCPSSSLPALLVVTSIACSGGTASNPSPNDVGSGGNTSDGGSGSSGSSSGGSSSGGTGSGGSSSGGSGGGASSGASASGGSASGSGGDGGSDSGEGSGGDGGGAHSAIKTVFVILMENNNWSTVTGDTNASYINGLLATAAYCDNYEDTPTHVAPSEPNYIWIEAGDNLGFSTDDPPSASHLQPTGTDHLVAQLSKAGVTWHTYEENLGTGGNCGIANSADGLYAPKHDPVVFFADIVGSTPSDSAAGCQGHIYDYSQLATDLANGTTAQYNFITPNLCDDMHNTSGCATSDAVGNGDAWLSTEVPKIQASAAYKNGGAIFITWDESEPAGSAVPIGMLVLSPLAKPPVNGTGYVSHTAYFHSSLLRTVETIFGVPFLRDAAKESDLGDLFTTFP